MNVPFPTRELPPPPPRSRATVTPTPTGFVTARGRTMPSLCLLKNTQCCECTCAPGNFNCGGKYNCIDPDAVCVEDDDGGGGVMTTMDLGAGGGRGGVTSNQTLFGVVRDEYLFAKGLEIMAPSPFDLSRILEPPSFLGLAT